MDKTISVIIPVYNVEAYLPQCLDSVLSQDYADLEVLLIDDGSGDGSGAICDAYAARDSRVRVLHQENGGAAAAKNAGLRLATGYYLSFVDSDDFLEPGAYSYMVSVLEEAGADAAQFALQNVYLSRTEPEKTAPGRKNYTGTEFLARFTQDWACAILPNKLYKRALFDGVFCEEGHRIDDEYVTYLAMMNARRVVCDSRVVYNYRRRASSAMLSPASQAQLALDRIDAIAKRRPVVIARFPELRRVFDEQFLDALCYTTKYPDNTPQSIALMKGCLRDYLRRPGNTLPPKCFWRDLWELAVTPAETLLQRYGKERRGTGAEDCFP